jgi:hypothetical protein
MCVQNLYFNKEEERLLRALLAKMKSQADKVRVLPSESKYRKLPCKV